MTNRRYTTLHFNYVNETYELLLPGGLNFQNQVFKFASHVFVRTNLSELRPIFLTTPCHIFMTGRDCVPDEIPDFWTVNFVVTCQRHCWKVLERASTPFGSWQRGRGRGGPGLEAVRRRQGRQGRQCQFGSFGFCLQIDTNRDSEKSVARYL